MRELEEEIFVCIDCEATGLDLERDRIIEVAVVVFNFSTVLDSFETLIDPERPIPNESIEIHHITPDMVKGKPKAAEVLPKVLELAKEYTIIGHGIAFDINMLSSACKRSGLPPSLEKCKTIDTLRLARLYGKSTVNSLEALRSHFNIPEEGAHRAMSDVIVNIEVFKYLTKNFKNAQHIFKELENPIEMALMPLGKHKGRPFKEIPLDYLKWAVHKDFDQDLLHSLRLEIKRRKDGSGFHQASSPFSDLSV